MIDDYQELINAFLPQHPFVRKSFDELGKASLDFTGPAFRDFTLAKLISTHDNEDLAQLYFDESVSGNYFPSQIFFDCYMRITNGIVNSKHLSYIYDSFRAKATAKEIPYLQCSEVHDGDQEDGVQQQGMVLFGMLPNNKESVFDMTVESDIICFDQYSNIAIDMPNEKVEIGLNSTNSRIYNSSIICKQIVWNAQTVSIESYPPDESVIVSLDPMTGKVPTFEIERSQGLHVSAPNINDYYKLLPYKYDFEDNSNVDIIKFTHALRCILMEFRTHKKDTLAKESEMIDNIVIGSSLFKSKVLAYLKARGVIFLSVHLYKINTVIMQNLEINYTAISRMNITQMQVAYKDFCKWISED